MIMRTRSSAAPTNIRPTGHQGETLLKHTGWRQAATASVATLFLVGGIATATPASAAPAATAAVATGSRRSLRGARAAPSRAVRLVPLPTAATERRYTARGPAAERGGSAATAASTSSSPRTPRGAASPTRHDGLLTNQQAIVPLSADLAFSRGNSARPSDHARRRAAHSQGQSDT